MNSTRTGNRSSGRMGGYAIVAATLVLVTIGMGGCASEQETLARVSGSVPLFVAEERLQASRSVLNDRHFDFATVVPAEQSVQFTLGAASGPSDERSPRGPVSVARSFAISRYEVTNGLFANVMGAALDAGLVETDGDALMSAVGDRQKLLSLAPDGSDITVDSGDVSVIDGREDYPVTNVTWYGAVFFCHAVNAIEGRTSPYDVTTWTVDNDLPGYRLPTEVEWELAARGGSKGIADEQDTDEDVRDIAWIRDGSNAATAPVGELSPNAIKVHDMLGNVWEWTGSWYRDDYYQTMADRVNPDGPNIGTLRVGRGSSAGLPELFARITIRGAARPGMADDFYGFRPVLVADGET